MTVVSINEAARQRAVDINDRIASLLKGDAVTSAEVQSLIDEAEAAATAAIALAEATKENSLDPRLGSADARRARETAFEADWQNERLATALASLRKKLVEAKAVEDEVRRRRDYDGAVIERDRIAAELKEFYPEAERRLAKIIAALVANDQELMRINSSAMPKGGVHLKSAELIARDLDGWKIGINEVTRISTELVWVRFVANPHDPYVYPVKQRW